MTEQKQKPELKSEPKPESKPTFAVRNDTGTITSKRYHQFTDCGKIVRTDLEALEPVNEREIGLLGLKACSACERRSSGGPAVDALVKAISATDGIIFAPGHTNPISESDQRDAAFNLLDTLREMGFYVASRRKTD